MVLNSFRYAKGAEFQDGDRRGCLKGTRVDALDEIELWARDFNKSPVYWLNGLAGTGKTTMAQTIAERLFADGRLGASFFCSRNYHSDDRSNPSLIFPTLAVQLARKYPQFRTPFVRLARSNPQVSLETLSNQMDKLIVQPLNESGISTVIVIDALDECGRVDGESTSAILFVLGQFVSEVPKVKFFVTGRPDPQIWKGFRLPLLEKATDVLVLHEVEPRQVANDIRLFFRHELSSIARRRGGVDDLPTKEQMDLLCERAAGFFAYAAATVEFIDDQRADPRERLHLLLQLPESSSREGELIRTTALDSFYHNILRKAFGDVINEMDFLWQVSSVIGTMILAANPISPSAIAMLLGLDALEHVLPVLSSVQSLLILREDINSPVRLFHKSFLHFITGPSNYRRRFHVSPPVHHSKLLITCLDLMNRTLEKNICKLPDAVTKLAVSDLEERAERYTCPGLQYACRSWHTHLVGEYTKFFIAYETTFAIHRFLNTKFLLWLDVLSLLGAARTAMEALQAAADWLEVRRSSTLDVLPDILRLDSGISHTRPCQHLFSLCNGIPQTDRLCILSTHSRPTFR
ncbi:hypothetical protein BJ322DRAFT_1007178 [Thelephora terrestris]|uniref:NACHT domain-containing protein n=1 Tax=Thelephora terrestris TaxID=56493 RepID=A0A9P6L5J7_9AGAM|nr:hypothetical protein BJ322DRAFT_1007178 [Thelephora terrestris]